MTFSFRDRYRLLWRALCVALDPKSNEAVFVWRTQDNPEIKPHCFYAEDKKSVDLIFDCFSEVIVRADSVEDANKRATGFLLHTAALYCDKHDLPRDHLVVYSQPLLAKTDLEETQKQPTFSASFLNKD